MKRKLGQMLIEAGAIDEAQLRAALADQRRWGRPLGRTLVELRFIREDDLVRVLGQQLGLPSIDLDKVAIPRAVVELVPVQLARAHNLIAFAQQMKFLDVAMLDPTNLGIIDELRIRTQLNIRAHLAGPKMIERAIVKYYGGETALDEYQVLMATPSSRPATIPPERSSVSIGSEVRDGLRVFPSAPGPSAHVPSTPPPPVGPPPIAARHQEIDALQTRISKLEALVARDEDVLRKLLALLIDKGLATRDEIVERLG